MKPSSTLLAALAAVLLLSLPACGSATITGVGFVNVTGLAPDQTLLCSSGQGGPGESTVLVLGSGFLSEHGTNIQILWTAVEGTPFEGGTSATTTTSGTVLSDTQVEAGVPDGFGTFDVTITVILTGGNAGTSEPQTITIGGVLVGPFANLDIYNDNIGNVPTSVAAPGVLANDIPTFCANDEETPEKPTTGHGTAMAAFEVVVPPTGFETDATPGVARPTALGGTVTIQTDGGFLYSPPVGRTGVTDSFWYWMQEGSRGPDRGLVFLDISDMVWFVDSNDDGANTGHFDDPFLSIDDLMNAQGGGPNLPAPGHTIFIYDQGPNDPYDGLIQLLDDQRLIGERTGLVIGGRTIVPAGTAPVLVNTDAAIGEILGDTVVSLADRNEVRGLDIQAPAFFGIHGLFVQGPTVIDEVEIDGTISDGIRLEQVTGTFTVGEPVMMAMGPRVRVTNGGGHGISLSGDVEQIPVATALAGSTSLVVRHFQADGLMGGLNGFETDGIFCVNADLDVRESVFDDCLHGIHHIVDSGPCASFLQDCLIGENAPMRQFGIVLEPFGAGAMNATVSGCLVRGSEQALRAGSFFGNLLTIGCDDSTFENLVTGNIPAVDFITGAGTTITSLRDNVVIGNNTGGGIRAGGCVFDAAPGTMGIQVVPGGNLTIGTNGALRVEDTALALLSCTGALDIDTLTIWQVIGDPNGYVNTGMLTLTITTEVIDVTP